MKKKLLGVVLVLSLIGLFGFVGTSYASVSPDITKLINLDSDNDGYSDLCEFLHKSDPYDPESKSSANITINVPSDVNSIQEAINIAIDGDTISVAQGRYQGNINFKGKSITLTSTDPQSFDVVSKTIIEGTEPGSVITIDSNSTLKGLTITSPDLDCRGMCVKSSSPTIENCTIIDNETTQSSGGIYITKTTSRPKITNCIITGNKDSTGTHESAQISGDTPQISYSWINGQGLTSSSEETGSVDKEPILSSSTTVPDELLIETATPDTEPSLEVIDPGSPAGDTVIINVTTTDLENFDWIYLSCDGNQLGIDKTEPLQYNWNTTRFTNGLHTLKAKGHHRVLNEWIESLPVSVTVSNATSDVPSVTITNLTEGQTVSGNFTISASLSHPVEMTRLSTYFYIDAQYLGPSFSSPASRIWATKYFPNGAHTVKVVSCYCDPGLTFKIKCEDSVSVNVNNTTTLNPEVRINNLVDGQEVQGTVTIQASTTDPANMLAVICYINGKWIGYDSSVPYQFTWHTEDLENVLYTIKVMSYHGISGLYYQKEITVNVNNPDEPNEVLLPVEENYNNIQDLISTVVSTSKIGDLPQSDTVTYQIMTKASDKTKIVSSDVTIITNGEKISITEAGKDPVIFDSSIYAPATSTAQMNYFYNMDEFFDKHTVTILGHTGNIFTLQAVPHEEELYSKMVLTVDYASGLELSCEIYDVDGDLAYKTEMLNYEHIGEANVPIQSKETIYLEQGTIVKTATYTGTQINNNIGDGEFEIGEE